MSKFQVGDRVRCVKADARQLLFDGQVYEVTDVAIGAFFGSSICVDGKNDDWWYADRFELVTPPESPDDWVTQDVVSRREGVDECRWVRDNFAAMPWKNEWCGGVSNAKHGEWHERSRLEVRCRRRDFPQRPVEVHTGGPYVARSEYDRVQSQVENQRDRIADLIDRLGEMQRELANEKASSGQVIGELRKDIETLHEIRKVREQAAMVTQAESMRYAEKCEKLKDEQKILLADLKDIEQTVIHLNKRVFATNPNGWPLVPVDPSCIPEGHRAVQISLNVKGKLIVSEHKKAIKVDWTNLQPRLVVEPIPAPTTDTLTRPEFPAWIRAGWWVAMDADRDWYGYREEPTILHSEDQWVSPGPLRIMDDQVTPSMQSIPSDRWREAKWQVE